MTYKIDGSICYSYIWQQKSNIVRLWIALYTHQNAEGYINLIPEQLMRLAKLTTDEYTEAISFLTGHSDNNCFRFISVIDKNNIKLEFPPRRSNKNKPVTWRTNSKEGYQLYLEQAKKAYDTMVNNREFMIYLSEQFPKYDIQKTLFRCFDYYWFTKYGWKNKRKTKTNKIDWYATIEINFDKNAVYKGN